MLIKLLILAIYLKMIIGSEVNIANNFLFLVFWRVEVDSLCVALPQIS